MIIQCPHCQSRFKLPVAKMKTGGTKVRCTKCKSMFVVTPPETQEGNKFGQDNRADFYEIGPGGLIPPGVDQEAPDFFGDFDAADFFGRGEENNDFFLSGEPVPELVFEDSSADHESAWDAGQEAAKEELPLETESPALPHPVVEEKVEKLPEKLPFLGLVEEESPSLWTPPPSVFDTMSMDPAPAPLPSPVQQKQSAKGLWILLLIVMVAGSYLIYSQGHLDSLPGYLQSWQNQPETPVFSGNLRPSGLTGFHINNKGEGGLFVVQGQVVNEDVEPRAGILLAGLVYDKGGSVIARQTVYGGNPISRSELRSLSYEIMKERMNNQFGEALSNINVEPKKSLPFTIVFKEVAADVAEFGVEVIDSKPVAGQ